MISKNWLSESVRVCAISSVVGLLACAFLRAQPPQVTRKPAVALLDPADAADWQKWTGEIGWQLILWPAPPDSNIDTRVLNLASAVDAAVKAGTADPLRVYVVARGEASAAVWYAISRTPDRYAAGAAIGGSPKAAIDSGRIFAANFTHVPVLWVSDPPGEALAQKLKAAGLNLEWRPVASASTASVLFQWLGQHHGEEFPTSIDCETNSPTFAHCYWIDATKFDPAERNDVLPSTRIPGSNGAALDLGGFSYKLDEPGPGVLIASLPPKYSGPLKVGDRLVELDGRSLANAHAFQDMLEKVTEDQRTVVMVQRGKDRVRIETRIVVPRHDPPISARVQAHYVPEEHEIEVVSRTVTEMRVNVPAGWLPARLLWNGLALEEWKEPGCWVLTMQKELLDAKRCQ